MEKVAVVTGGSRGIGRAVALALAGAGLDIIINYASREEEAGAVVEEIKALGRRGEAVQGDVSSSGQGEKIIKHCLAKFGKIDILVNNAGVTRDSLVLRMKEEDWDKVININLKGTYNCTRAALRPMLKARTGRVINLASVVGLTGNPGQANYAAAKAGVIGFTRSVAREVASRGITVNAVAPGFIETDMTAKLAGDTRREYLKQVPLGRFGEPRDVAAAVRFLALDAGYMTGQVLVVDGGLSTC